MCREQRDVLASNIGHLNSALDKKIQPQSRCRDLSLGPQSCILAARVGSIRTVWRIFYVRQAEEWFKFWSHKCMLNAVLECLAIFSDVF